MSQAFYNVALDAVAKDGVERMRNDSDAALLMGQFDAAFDAQPWWDAFFDEEGGRYIYFEGTYSFTFSGRQARTPLYDYNQMLYRLDLDDPRLKAAQE